MSSDVELLDVHCESRTRITVHSVQLLPEKSFRENENNDIISLDPGGNGQLTLRVVVRLCL